MTQDRSAIRIALAARAYHLGEVRLVARDLRGCTHVVATRGGLFATDGATLRLVAHGMFYGLAIDHAAIVAFEACDLPRSRTARGRIVRLHVSDGRIVASDILATGLDNGCHQLDLIGDRLCVTDTYNQRVLRFAADPDPPEQSPTEQLQPLPPAATNDWAGGYAHVNSLLAAGPDIWLLLHNGAGATGRASELARLDRKWRLVERFPLAGTGCHSLALLEDGTLICCGSGEGGLVTQDGRRIAVGDMMTRGLSVGADGIVVGGSTFADRATRDAGEGALFFLDRAYRPLRRLAVPAPVMEVRRIDGRDRSLSNFIRTGG